MRKRDRIQLVLAALLLLAGAGVLLYPAFRTAILQSEEQTAITGFEQYRASAENAANGTARTETADKNVIETERPFLGLWQACVEFNEWLYETEQTSFTAESQLRPSIRLSDYGWTEEAFGYISIPAAGIKAPLYLGGSLANLDKGAAILGQTSMPIGGENTNCVIAGHRTWSGAIQFKRLETLCPGDKVYLANPWETLTYEVIETKVIQPNDTVQIMIQPDRDLLSIFTCTDPNTHRYLVICERKEGGRTCN